MATFLLFPLPGTYQDKPLSIHTAKPNGQAWPEINAWAAWQFDCDADDVDLIEIGDDDTREALTIKGEIVGVLDAPLTAARASIAAH